MQFRAKNGAIGKKIAPMRASQISRITSDLKMNVMKMRKHDRKSR